MKNNNVLRDMIADYQDELKECNDAIELMEDKVSTYKNRAMEIEEILIKLTEKHESRRT